MTSAPKQQVSIAVGDDERLVDLYVPADLGGETTPLIVMLHGNGESPFVMGRTSQIGVVAAREGLLVALPPARENRWEARIADGDPITQSPDVVYVMGLIDRLVADYPIDRDRVFVAGFSMGAVLSERLACQYAGRITAVAIDAGAPWSSECQASEPVSVLVMHGTEDGTLAIGGAGEIVARWREIDGCQGEPKSSGDATVEHETNDACRAGTAVWYDRYIGAGHRWFADATDRLWTFFRSRTKGS